jgi:uncharacterized membrane protein YpjA
LRLAEALKVKILVALAALTLTHYGVRVEALAVQIETSIEQALAQVSTLMVAFTAFIVLAAILLLRLLTGKNQVIIGIRS